MIHLLLAAILWAPATSAAARGGESGASPSTSAPGAKSSGAAPQIPWREDLAPALAAAKEKGSLVLVDFSAPWCYSCYYMDQNVLSRPELAPLYDRFEWVRMDVDSPQGSKLKNDWRVRFLPSYVLLNPDGLEVDRIAGEQRLDEFVDHLHSAGKQYSTLDQLRARISKTSGLDAVAVGARILKAYVQREEPAEGLAFFGALAPELRSSLGKNAASAKELLRLRLARAAQAKDEPGCLSAGRDLLAMGLGCDLPYDSWTANACLESSPRPQREVLFELEDARLKPLLKDHVFTAPEKRCADFRSPVELAVEIGKFRGRDADQKRVLNRAIELMSSEIAGDYKKDRNKDDNLRVFLEMAERNEELDALYPKLISAFPDDYVYAYRYGKFLAARSRPDRAMSQFDAALGKAYGANRLSVVGERAKALARLGRKPEALKDLTRAMQDHPATFPDAVARLGQIKAEIEKSAP